MAYARLKHIRPCQLYLDQAGRRTTVVSINRSIDRSIDLAKFVIPSMDDLERRTE